MRLFIAIDLPGELRKSLGQMEKQLRAVTDTARWVVPESIHITLKFLGEVPEARVPEIDGALLGLSWKPITVTVRGVGFFPGNRSPRVFWAGMEAPTMPGLAEQLDTRMDRLGFEKEKRAYRPHITLARARESRMETALVTAAKEFEQHEFGSFIADRVFLFQSTLKPTGAVYTKLKEYPFER
jgi:RNA 2',3'-cyclic 3'-phosphodiesterase